MIPTFANSTMIEIPASADVMEHSSFVAATMFVPSPVAPVERVVVEPEWRQKVAKNLAEIAKLKPGWDGPGSRAISRSVIYKADVLLLDALGDLTTAKAPFIVPRANGSLQFEWASEKYEAEFYLDINGDRSFWICNRNSGMEFEGHGDEATELLFRWAKRVASVNGNALNVPVQTLPERYLFAA
jgi:hypothetical protein